MGDCRPLHIVKIGALTVLNRVRTCSSEFVLDHVSVTCAGRTTARDLVASNPIQALELSVTSARPPASCLFTFFTFPPAHPFDPPTRIVFLLAGVAPPRCCRACADFASR